MTRIIPDCATMLCIALFMLPTTQVAACNGAENIRLVKPVSLSAQERAEFQSMPTLKIMAVGAPPMAHYNEDTQTYNGIGTDILCFIANELGIRYEIPPARDITVAEKIKQVQEGRADMFLSLSRTPERARQGVYTAPYYESYYAIIARHGSRAAAVLGLADLSEYQIGYVKGVSFETLLKAVVPGTQLHAYDQTSSDGLFQAVQDGVIDAAVFNKSIFIEKRYRQELFDLEVVHTLREYPRAYRFYFSQSPEHQRLVEAFNRYLAAIDTSLSVARHEAGERHFLERYIAQRHQQMFLVFACVATALLALFFYLMLLRHRRLSRLLAERNVYIKSQQQALQEAYKRLEALSLTDTLTSLSNRRHFDQVLNHEYARYLRTGSPLSLIIIDVDHFKSVNDHYGHAVGDDYLRAIARALESAIFRSTDLVARYGGEEFMCLLTGTTSKDAYKVAERIQHHVAELGLPNALATPPRLTMSIGIATVLRGDPGPRELFAQADMQLYTAKRMGRDQICATIIPPST